MTSLYSVVQPAKLQLYQIDTTSLAQQQGLSPVVLRWHNESNDPDVSLTWNGMTFQNYPVKASGFAKTTAGSLPSPRLQASNVFGLLYALADGTGLVGAILTRWTIWETDLDNRPGANPLNILDQQRWVVSRYVKLNALEGELELAHPQLFFNVGIPSRRLGELLE